MPQLIIAIQYFNTQTVIFVFIKRKMLYPDFVFVTQALFRSAAHFLLALVAASISHFVTTATKFSCCSSNKKMCLLCFLSLALDLCRPFLR